jgi:hypothetical protein
MKNMIRLKLAGPLGALLLAGCAAHPDPIVDMQGVDSAMYQQDLNDCQGYGDQIDTATGVTKGVAAGGAVGAATGAISGHTAEGAGYGAIAGGARSAQLNEREKQRVVKNCMHGRGYRVLN